MATGGVFQLLTNDGKQDKMLMATALLTQRLAQIQAIRSKNPKITDPSPTLVDIERTHIFFMNAHFKPFCAIGYEYAKVNTQAGTAKLGSSVTFSIPQFGDFFHDMVLHVTLSSVTADNADYWTDAVDNPPNGTELLQYVDMLGQKLVKNVYFNVNGNPLDQYNSDIMNFHQKFFVTPNKQTGWLRNIGQELPWAGHADLNNANGRFGRGAGVREKKWFTDGPQTPKPVQDAIDIWMPLLFWFNIDPRLSIPSVSIPFGQRYIVVDFARPEEILQHLHAYNPALDAPGNNPPPVPDLDTCELYINNIFVNSDVHAIFIKRIGFSLIRVHRYQNFNVSASQQNLLMNNMKWPIETLYIGLQPSDNTDTTNSKMLKGWHMYCEVDDRTVHTNALQNAYAFSSSLPSSAITAANYTSAFVSFTGLALDFAVALGVATSTVLTVNQLNAALTANDFPPLIGTFANASAPTKTEITAALPNTQAPATYTVATPTMDTLGITAHSIPLYQVTPTPFYNSYLPYTYGGPNINTPDDVGALQVTFNLYPGSYQPSGHVNISRAREFYANYASSTVGTSISSAIFVVIGIAINFLLISDGSALLRYST